MRNKKVFQSIWMIALVVLLCASQSGSVSASINAWTLTGLAGHNIDALAIDPKTPSTLYAGEEAAGYGKASIAATPGTRPMDMRQVVPLCRMEILLRSQLTLRRQLPSMRGPIITTVFIKVRMAAKTGMRLTMALLPIRMLVK